MDLAAEFTELPWATTEEVDDALREQGEHEQEVGNSQVHHEHVCWSPEGGESAEDLQDESIANERGGAHEEVDEAEEVVPGRVDRLMRMPVRQEETADLGRREVVQSEAVG